MLILTLLTFNLTWSSKMQENNQTPLFEIDSKNRYVSVDKSLFVQTLSYTPALYTEHREMSALGVYISARFTLIENNLFLNTTQLCELFGVGDKTLRDHLNNIYGFWLHCNQGQNDGGDFPPHHSLVILEIPVTFDPRASVGGGGGTKNTYFYHHDVITELAFRINNPRARVVAQFIKNLVHEYNRTGLVMNPQVAVENVYNYENAKKAFSEFVFYRMLVSGEIKYKLTEFVSRCSNSGDGYRNLGVIYGSFWNTLHVSVVGKKADEIIFTQCDHTSPNCGINFWSKFIDGSSKFNLSDLVVALNYYNQPQLEELFCCYTSICKSLNIFLNKNPTWQDMLRFVHKLCAYNYNIHYIGEDLHKYNFYPDNNLILPDGFNRTRFVKQENSEYKNYLINKNTLTEIEQQHLDVLETNNSISGIWLQNGRIKECLQDPIVNIEHLMG